jgi:hypothetical protein
MRPSAQATCARTSGSGSPSADASVGTSDAVPTLPIETAALRFKSRSFARFIGEFLNAALNSSWDISSSSRAS